MTKTILAVAALLVVGTQAQAATKIRGTIASLEATTLNVTPSEGGSAAIIAFGPGTPVAALVPAKLADITPGSFIGTAATTQPDGTLVAREVHIFPESMRGAGEGHRDFDLGPKSTMTNGTVGQEVKAASGDTLTVAYKGGQKTIVVPADAPVVMFAPGDRALLVPGAHVIVQAKDTGGALTAERIIVGKEGLTPPM